jgi:glycerate kinase
MRVVVAMDSFGATSADAVSECLSGGWSEIASSDDLELVPLSDGGPGFVQVLAFMLPQGPDLYVDAEGPTGEPHGGYVVVAGPTAYVECAYGCGLDQLQRRGGDVRTATTYGVGEFIAAAAAFDGVETVVVGLGGSGTNDGGGGMWAALGAEPADVLRGGGVALRDLQAVTVPDLGVKLIAATDVDNRLLGLYGASAVYGPQKGADEAAVIKLDAALEHWADVVEAAVDRPGLRNAAGAGAAGGLGFGLMALGATRASGIDIVMDVVDLKAKVEAADLVITGEGKFDHTSLRGKVVSGVARVAQGAGVPCVVAAGQAEVGTREAAANGIDDVFSIAELLGSPEAALAAGQAGIRELGRAVARAWSRR